MDRRDFLKLTLAAGGAVALAPVLGTEAAVGSLHVRDGNFYSPELPPDFLELPQSLDEPSFRFFHWGQYQPACVRCANGPLHVRDAEGNPRLFWPKAGVVRLGPDGEIRLEEQRCSPGNCERVTARRQWAQTVESRPPW